MALKTELRRLRVLGCEANARVVTLHLHNDTPLEPAKITALIRTSHGAWKLTPDMRLSRRFDAQAEGDGLSNAEATLAALAACLKEG